MVIDIASRSTDRCNRLWILIDFRQQMLSILSAMSCNRLDLKLLIHKTVVED